MHIFGRIRNATTGAPVAGARVVLDVGGRSLVVNSDGDGHFTWRNDTSSSGHRLEYRADKSGFEGVSGSHELDHDELELMIELRPRSLVVPFLVSDPAGRPLNGADVRLERDGRVVAEATSGETGIAELTLPVDASDAELRYRVFVSGFQPVDGVLEPLRSNRIQIVLWPVESTGPEGRLAAVRQHPDYASLIADRPSSARLYVSNVAGVIAGILFIGFGVAWIWLSSRGPVPAGLSAVGFLFIAFGAALAIYGLVRVVRLASEPVGTSPAHILGKRTQVWGGGKDSSARTNYFLTLELEDGDRRELSTGGRLYGLVAESDVGIAFIRGTWLLDFRRLEV